MFCSATYISKNLSGKLFLEQLGFCRVAHFGIQHHHFRVDRSQAGQGPTVGLAAGDLFSRLIGRLRRLSGGKLLWKKVFGRCQVGP
jgi:hypothetical protein